MKTYFVFLVSLILISPVLAHGGTHSSLPEPGHTPGSIMYAVDILQEKVSLALTFSEEERMHKKIKFARERLAESAKLMEKNRSEKAAEMTEKYVKTVKQVENQAQKLNGSKKTQVMELVNNTKTQDNQVLTSLIEELPEDASQRIKTAIENRNKAVPETPDSETPDNIGPNNSQPENPRTSTSGYIATGKVISTE